MNSKETKRIPEASAEYWLEIAERYFDASTTDEEERALKQFLATEAAGSPAFDEIKAVMGYIAAGRKAHAQPKHTHINTVRTLMRAAAIILVAGLSFTAMRHVMYDSDNICITYINGQKYTDERIAIAKMENIMREMNSVGDNYSADKQLHNILKTINH